MQGAKMTMMKETLEFLVSKGLQPGDAFGLVAFDDQVETRLPLTLMDSSGRKSASEVINALTTGRTTNLSGGLLEGIDLVQRGVQGPQQTPSARPRTRAVLLFTDGIANCGIRDGPGILAAAQGAMGGSPLTLFTFGFGADHTENTLRSLAEATNGLYYFVQRSEDIPQAFVDCLGGLVSVVAQNATLTLEAVPGVASIGGVHGTYQHDVRSETCVAVNLGDLYSEDEKDVLLQLQLPAHPAAALDGGGGGGEGPLTMTATLRYFCVASSRMAEARCELCIARPTAPPAAQPPNMKLDEQRNRLAAAEAMEKASRLADGGELSKGLALLRQATADMHTTPSAKSPLCVQLCADLERVATGYASAEEYRARGAKMSKMQAMSHMQQRSNCAAEGMYEKSSKAAYKKASGFFG